MFTKDQIDVNCSEPACLGLFRDIYCHGPIIWAAWHFGMQKECPGSRMRFDAKTVLRNFDRSFEQGKLHRDAFVRFCEENFDRRPYLEEAHLPDWKPDPQLLRSITNMKMRIFANEIHKIWPKLGRRFVEDVHQAQDHYPLMPVPNTFVVSGNLVQIYYYWDTFWIVKGLLMSEMFDTAKGIIRNFAHVMKSRGHIPNSGIIQHQRRSQPPMYTKMVADYFDITGDKAFLEEILPSVETELMWWRQNRTVKIRMDDGADEYTAYQYKTRVNCPRPGNLMLDYYYAMESSQEDLEYIWSSTHSAVESGMDFSTRWFTIDSNDDELAYTRKGIRTNDIVPVDLNVYMALNYRTVARLYGKELGNMRKGKFYSVLANSLAETIEMIFRDKSDGNGGGNDATGVWFDYDLVTRQLRRRFFPVNIFPLLLFAQQHAGTEKWVADCAAAVEFMKRSGAICFKGGIPSSMARGSTETWDFPNGEPRILHLTVLSLLKCAHVNPQALTIARKVTDQLLTTAFNGFFHPRRGMPAQIWEKYDVRFEDGRSGFGGDYIPQTGFGSTNGALLDLIRIFYTTMTNSSSSSYNNSDGGGDCAERQQEQQGKYGG